MGHIDRIFLLSRDKQLAYFWDSMSRSIHRLNRIGTLHYIYMFHKVKIQDSIYNWIRTGSRFCTNIAHSNIHNLQHQCSICNWAHICNSDHKHNCFSNLCNSFIFWYFLETLQLHSNDSFKHRCIFYRKGNLRSSSCKLWSCQQQVYFGARCDRLATQAYQHCYYHRMGMKTIRLAFFLLGAHDVGNWSIPLIVFPFQGCTRAQCDWKTDYGLLHFQISQNCWDQKKSAFEAQSLYLRLLAYNLPVFIAIGLEPNSGEDLPSNLHSNSCIFQVNSDENILIFQWLRNLDCYEYADRTRWSGMWPNTWVFFGKADRIHRKWDDERRQGYSEFGAWAHSREHIWSRSFTKQFLLQIQFICYLCRMNTKTGKTTTHLS